MKLCKIAYLMFGVTLITAHSVHASPNVVDTNSKRYDAARAEALSAQNADESMRAGMKAELMEEEAAAADTVDTNAKRFDKARSEALSKSKKMEGERAQLNLDSEVNQAIDSGLSGVVDTNPKRFDAARAKAQNK